MARASKRKDETSEAGGAEQDAPGDGIDTMLDRLEAVVEDLESGDLPLERALERFEEGVRLARRGRAMLGAVEERIEALLADRDDVAPFSADEEESK